MDGISPRPSSIRARSQSQDQISSSSSSLLSLPDEILEQIFLLLDLNGRLRLRSACRALRHTHSASAQCQYRFTLDTSAYLDVPFQVPPLPPTASSSSTDLNDANGISQPPSPGNETNYFSSRNETDATRTLTFRSPHTQNPRQCIPSVTLAPWPKDQAKFIPYEKIVSPADKNEILASREKRWQSLDWAQKRVIKVQGKEGVYELQEGIFLMCDDFNDWEDDKPSTIRLIPLPSATDPDLEDPPLQTKASRVPFPISDLTMDPTQDLIVVSEFRPDSHDASRSPPTHRYHLLSLSTFQPHPLASLPTLDFPPFTQAIMDTRQLLQVMGDTLLVLVSRYAPAWVLAGLGLGLGALGGWGHEEEIVAWNWKTGRVLARLSLPENGWFSSFALLSPTTFMITSTSSISPVMPSEPRAQGSVFPPVIQIYSFAPDPNNPINPVQPLDTDPMDDTTPRPVLLAQLELPKFALGVMITAFDVRPDPAFPPHKAGMSAKPNPALGKGKPFTQDPAKGILVFDLRVVAPHDEGQLARDRKKSYELFVLRETLVKMAVAGERRLQQAWDNGGDLDGLGIRGVERTISWVDWGEKGARIMDATMKKRSWVCSCAGYRFISLVPALRPPGHGLWPLSEESTDIDDEERDALIPRPKRSDLCVFDFSPVSLRRHRSELVEDVPSEEAYAGSTSITEQSGSEVGAEGKVDHDQVMMDSEAEEDQIDHSLDYLNSVNDHITSLPFSPSSGIRLQRRSSTGGGGSISRKYELKSSLDPSAASIVKSNDSGSVALIEGPTVIDKRHIWKEDVKSSLPFLEIRRDYGGLANGVMCDDQRIIVVHTRRNGDWGNITQEMTVLCM
ncbi:hypothetical protein I316_01299 [Kwoniella heveanensis BCC8398]|uniref:F-box domain-containing protein n=1 Tax=Kwoniella heveanensis BCC8398 TaxID=1296120 RepID=A0A1B9H0A4_9TREE|nr:hypothetical protein I316_01299 [Kwoniella heveanensis BCC8398]